MPVYAQVLNCTGADEGCQNTTTNAFDQQKSAVVGSLFQLLLASVGHAAPGMQVNTSGPWTCIDHRFPNVSKLRGLSV